MKKLIVVSVFALAIFFTAKGSLLLGSEASPTAPIAKTQREMLSEKTGFNDSKTMMSPALATVLPNPEYRKLPAFDFVPKRLRGKN